MLRVGIPRALLYYNYYPAWKSFFESLGAEIVLSDKTTKKILEDGIRVAVDETCLPVKLFFGHVINLKEKNVDFLFIPRLVSVERKRYLCPKFLGLPNMVNHLIKDLPPLAELDIDVLKETKGFYRELYNLGKRFSNSPGQVYLAYRRAMKALKAYEGYLQQGKTPLSYLEGAAPGEETRPSRDLSIAVLGHSYNLNDPYISMDIFNRLGGMGARVYTCEMFPESAHRLGVSRLRKDIFWTFGKEIIGSAFYLLEKKMVDGVILLVSFGCGPDSLVGELVERVYKRKKDIPLLYLTLDEHSGEAGFLTRLEAFVDMVYYRKEILSAGGTF